VAWSACHLLPPFAGFFLVQLRPLDILQESVYLPVDRLGGSLTKSTTDLLQGTLDVLILKTLVPGAMHGWGIAQRIQQVSQDVLRVNQGSLYPALHRLEEEGWIAAEWGSSENNRKAKFYRLTRTGQRQLEAETENWKRLAEAVGRVLQTT
jgi:PadR family transcriptional regulator, regulatory protein PadR